MSDLRTIERESIRAFVEQAGIDGYLSGRVLDYGCGKQPYRSLVESFGAEYMPYDHSSFPANVSEEDVGDQPFIWPEVDYDAILCTQVVQYIPLVRYGEEPGRSLQGRLTNFRLALTVQSGHLILTYPTNWPEVEPEDLHRFTKAGMERLLTEAGFEIVRHEPRFFARLYSEDVPPKQLSPEWLALGYGVIARA